MNCEYRDKQQERRIKRLEQRRDRLMQLEYEGYKIAYINYDTYLVNGLVYVSLIHNNYRNKKTNETGSFWDVKRFIRQYIQRFKNIDYIVDWHEAPRLPYFWFLRFRPKLKKFVRDYNQYQKNAVKYHKDFFEVHYND